MNSFSDQADGVDDRYTPRREPAFYLICFLYSVLAWIPIQGITIWYDEAWRFLAAVSRPLDLEFLTRWFAHGLPVPISLPHMLLIRFVHGFLGLPSSEYVLRLVNLGAAFIAFHEIWIIASRWSGRKTTGLAAAALLAANPYFGYYVFSIKEHMLLVVFLLLWARRLQRLVKSDGPTSSADIFVCLSLILFSPLAASGIGAAAVWLAASKLDGRPARHDLRLLLLGVLPAALWSYAQVRCATFLERDFERFCFEYGLETLPPGSLYGTGSAPLSDRLLNLAGSAIGESNLFYPVGTVWLVCLLLAVWRACSRRNRSDLILLAAALGAPATLLFFELVTGRAAPRMVLWLAPLLAMVAPMILLDRSSRRHWPGFILLIVLLLSTGMGWMYWWRIYPEKVRYHEFISRSGPFRFDRGRDVIIHTQALLYYPHAVLDPLSRKVILPVPEEGTAMMTLHRDCPVRVCLGVAPDQAGSDIHPQWSDTSLRQFDGNAAWAVTMYAFSPALTGHLERNLFDGDNRVDTFIDWPYFWTRVERSGSTMTRDTESSR